MSRFIHFFDNFLTYWYRHFINKETVIHVCSKQEWTIDILLNILRSLLLANIFKWIILTTWRKQKFWQGSISLPITTNKYKSSRSEVLCKKLVLRNFAKFTGKHLYQRLFLMKTLAQVFSFKFCEIFHRTSLMAASVNSGLDDYFRNT